MQKLIIIKYGELSTKKDNLNYFLKTLKSNVDYALKGLSHETYYDYGRMFVTCDDLNEAITKLKKVFGIHEIIIGYEYDSKDLDTLKLEISKLIENREFKTFKVETKRSDKNYPLKSMEVSSSVGSYILKNTKGHTVDVHNPDLKINIEIRTKEALVYFNGTPSLGGYPVGTLGKGLLNLSGGIDSPVAGFLAIKRGIKIEAIYFESPPHTSELAKQKVLDLCKVLSEYNMDLTIHIVNFTSIQESILHNIPNDYLITIMRRMMYRISEKVANMRKCKILINGESIGQVASQTLTSMSVINEVVKIPVIRPVACFDKLEIIEIAKKIGTYDISIRPYMDCCTLFVPVHPVINPDLIKAIEYEKLIPWEYLITEAIKTKQTIKISELKENKYQDLL